MTDREYEAASVTAATLSTKYEIDHKLRQFDEIIAQTEATLARLQEERREFINRHNLNKNPKTSCLHYWNYNQEARRRWCSVCHATEKMEDL